MFNKLKPKVMKCNDRRVTVLLRGEHINHEGETYRLCATTDADFIEEQTDLMNVETALMEARGTDDDECGHSWGSANINGDTVYAIWLNELSRKYSGNELMFITDREELAMEYFTRLWEEQDMRWGFADETPHIDFTDKDIHAFYRNNGGDCEHVVGIARLTVDGDYWTVVEPV